MATKTHVPTKLLIKLRKLLHRYPELSGQETETAKRISGFLSSYKPTKLIDGIGGNGVAAVYSYFGSGPTVLIRCELDALPIEEINTFEHRSEDEHVSHKCGHDGHMSILAGLAVHFSKNRPKVGKVVLLFQPAEENGEGAKAVLEDPKFDEIRPDYVFALHNLPGYPMHKIVCCAGSFTASVQSIIIKLHGKTSHAGEPDLGINPALAIAEILQKTNKLQVPKEEKGFKQVTPIQIEMGEEAYGISAGYGEVKLTIRTWDSETMEELAADCEKLAQKIGKKYKLKVEIDWTQFFSANQNGAEMVEVVREAAKTNGFEFEEKQEPFRWGEDFGLFTEQFKGAMFGIGAGEKTPALHNPDYDFPDEITPTGVKMFSTIVDLILSK
ncbi:MAG: amidohydrolase [Flavobacteriales bacterium]|nr:amidohydrolase [Flavobacteriales bacterium]